MVVEVGLGMDGLSVVDGIVCCNEDGDWHYCWYYLYYRYFY